MAFDLDSFLNSTVTQPMATDFELPPEGDFPFLIDTDPKQLTVVKKEGISKAGAPYLFYQVELDCICQDAGVRAKLGRDRVSVRMQVGLDLDSAAFEQGRFVFETGPNKNVQLGRLRAALDQNKSDWSPKMLLGAGPFMGHVVHTTSEKSGRKFANVDRVAAIR